ncbi:beta-N-acetylglucosaminidase domain-containing protein [Phocaeicola dorei]|jgi:hyaluronoglucosaminidase|uniref:beta-N-acetylglucosaminidase domain-containing protein n=1 Tax=Phocaeicola dorei TaxID=357276 RepID=UPI001C9A24FD|nr:beta-N-acetylglucosaminidase domain-containing protein [Phocaeicola dorei]
MKYILKSILAGSIGMFAYASVAAQDFDVTSQKGEQQIILPVPGKKVNHQGIIINPTPQQCLWDKSKHLDLSNGVSLRDIQGKFSNDIGFITSHAKGVKLTIDFGEKVSAKKGVKAVSGAYVMSIGKRGISIVGYDERGAFYGIQTLRQLLESPVAKDRQLPYAEINDYPDLPNRGVVEGFYGTPWSHEVRLSLIDFYGRFKMNVYLYAPKDDPYHRVPHWRDPYPAKEANNIKELLEACKRSRVDFVWAIHPGGDIKWNEEDYQKLLNKFNNMYDLGVRNFAVFFDDVWGEGANPKKQTDLLNRLTQDFVNVKPGVSPLVICPSDYTELWSDPSPSGALATYGTSTDSDIQLLWTGEAICSDLTHETLNFVNSRIKRPAFFWWNFPVTDYVSNLLLQGPAYGLDTSLTAHELSGIASNPMEHGEASKLALYGVADYTWNVASYNPLDNWERGVQELVPEATAAYRTFAIHSCDTETRYRRDESWETKTFRIAEWSETDAEKLFKEFDEIERVPQEMEKCSNKTLLGELRPWLVEFGKLGKRGKQTIELVRKYRSGLEDSTFWNLYVGNLMSSNERKSYESHKSGTLKLQPFYENAMDDMGHEFLKKLTGEVPMDYKGIGSFNSVHTRRSLLMLDNDTTTFYNSGVEQGNGDWIGIDLRAERDVTEVYVLQGRNSVDDGDYFEDAVLEYSRDGNTWNTLVGNLHRQYEIEWRGEDVKARFVRLKRLDSKRTNFASIRSFTVNPIRREDVDFEVMEGDEQSIIQAFDWNLQTFFTVNGVFSFQVNPDINRYILLADSLQTPLTCRQYAKNGNLIAEKLLNSSFIVIEPKAEAARIQIEGKADIFEIIPKYNNEPIEK